MLKQPLHSPSITASELSPAARKFTGSHYTPARLAAFIAEAIVEHFEPTDLPVSIVDPAVGDGELLAALLRKLQRHDPAAKPNVGRRELNTQPN